MELSKISDWLVVNKLSLNTAKNKFMLFHNYQKTINKDVIPHLTINDTIISIFQFQFQIVYCHTLQESKGHTKVNTTFDSLHKNKISIHPS